MAMLAVHENVALHKIVQCVFDERQQVCIQLCTDDRMRTHTDVVGKPLKGSDRSFFWEAAMSQAHDMHHTIETVEHVGAGLFSAAVLVLSVITAATLIYVWFLQ
jgi:hypothetical protein